MLTLPVILLIHVFSHSLRWIPNPPAILLIVMVYTTFRSGLKAGFVSALLSWLYVAYFFSNTPQLFVYTDDNFHRVIIWAIAFPAVVLMVGKLRQALEEKVQHLGAEIDKHQETAKRLELQSIIVQNMIEGVCLIRAEDDIIAYASPKFESMFGYASGELEGQPAHILHHAPGEPIDTTNAEKVFRQLDAQGEATYEVHNLKKDGTPFLCRAHTSIFNHFQHGRVYVAIYEDITLSKQAEEQINYQASLLEHVSDAVISTDMNTSIRSWNKAAETIYGWTAAEVMGKSLVSRFQTEFSGTDREEALAQVITQGRWRGEVIQQRKDGSRVPILASTVLFKNSDGTPIGLISVNRDMTEHKRLEDEFFGAELLRVEAQKKQELLELKEDFIRMISHELRTPLSVIMLSSEILDRYRERLSAVQHLDHVVKIREHAELMTHMIENVLLVSKAAAEKMEINRTSFNLETFLHHSLEQVQLVVDTKHQIIFNYRASPTEVYMDEKLLQSILINLLSNAIKYSPEDSEIHFDVWIEEEQVVFRVKDQGIGIPENALPNLFEPFFRAKNTAHIQGTGLGLVIVRDNVVLHGGTIQVDSKEGVGTTFTVRLPKN